MRTTHKALDLLAQIAPREALARARELARAIERDEYVRRYISRRAVVVAAAGMASTAGFGMMAMFLIGVVSRHLAPFEPWLKIGTLLLIVTAWVGATVGVMYRLLASMQRAALAAKAQDDGAA